MTDKLEQSCPGMGPRNSLTHPHTRTANRAAPKSDIARLPAGDLTHLSDGAPTDAIRRLGDALVRWQKLRQGATPS